MAKRKAATVAQSPSKRVTRSSILLQETQPDPLTRELPRTPAKKVIRTYGSKSASGNPRKRTTTRESDRSSLKENGAESDASEDELILSPSKESPSRPTTPPPQNGATRLFMHSVEIITPSKRVSKLLPSTGSPAPARLEHPVPQTPSTPKKADPSPFGSTFKRTPVTSPTKSSPKKTFSRISTIKQPVVADPPASPTRLPRALPTHLYPCLNAQKRAVLAALQDPPGIPAEEADSDDDPPTNAVAFQQLGDLLGGTVSRGEGNSCLLLGPRGSGKTRLVDRCISQLPEAPIIIRLSGWAQHNDRLAMREIARQLTQQTGASFLSDDADDSTINDDVNPFVDADPTISLPPPSHLPALISVLPTLSRPTVVVLDAFDLFAEHARQSLLYCLLDTVQSCRVGQGNKGVAVVGITTRVDTINLLEKRVKSRFSGRMLRTAGPRQFTDWLAIAKAALRTPVDGADNEWQPMWSLAVDKLLADQAVLDTLNETFSLTRDVRVLSRILTTPILELTPSSPFPSSSQLAVAATAQRSRPQFPYLHTLAYPSICLLITTMHSQTAGHDVVTFEQLHECFRDQVRASTSAPVQVGGAGIGMVRCTREVLMSAFESLVSARYYVSITPPSASIAKEFVRYRCVVGREDVKRAVEKMGQTNLKKWFSKAQ